MKIKNILLIFILTFCLTTKSQTNKKLSKPEKDFEKFWTTFKDNYAFFQLKGVNWDETYKKYKPQINSKTKETELVKIFGEMVEPLKDGHITISKGEEILYKVKKPSLFKKEFKGIEKDLWKTSFETLKKNGFSEIKGIGPIVKDENLYYVSQNSELGFIRISRCFGNLESVFDDKKEVEDIKLMLNLFDSILNSFAKTKGIIIDIRANGGGHGGEELASRFAIEKIITHYKATRLKGGYENITELEPIYLTPNIGVKYTNPIVILTNDKTASSAEDFTISLYKQAGNLSLQTFPQLWDYYVVNHTGNGANLAEHIQMANSYVNIIACALQEIQTGICVPAGTQPSQIYQDLAWGGLEDTPAYIAKSINEKDRIQGVANAEIDNTPQNNNSGIATYFPISTPCN